MPFEILNKEIEIAVDQITAQVKRHKNGVVADSLKNAGILYEMSYGVSVVHLRNIASNYPPNNNLAKALWRKKWRETMMLATMLLEKESKSLDLLNEFSNEAQTEEVLQQIGMNALSSFPNVSSTIKDFLKSGNANKRIVACYAIIRLYAASQVDDLNADEITSLLLEVCKVTNDNNWIELNALAKAISKIGYVSNVDNNEILEFFKQRASLSRSWQVSYEMVKTEFEYR